MSVCRAVGPRRQWRVGRGEAEGTRTGIQAKNSVNLSAFGHFILPLCAHRDASPSVIWLCPSGASWLAIGSTIWAHASSAASRSRLSSEANPPGR